MTSNNNNNMATNQRIPLLEMQLSDSELTVKEVDPANYFRRRRLCIGGRRARCGYRQQSSKKLDMEKSELSGVILNKEFQQSTTESVNKQIELSGSDYYEQNEFENNASVV